MFTIHLANAMKVQVSYSRILHDVAILADVPMDELAIELERQDAKMEAVMAWLESELGVTSEVLITTEG